VEAEALTVKDSDVPEVPISVEVDGEQDGASANVWPVVLATTQVTFKESSNPPEDITETVIGCGSNGSFTFDFPWVRNTGTSAGGVPDADGALNATP
jgi:hypothetical protein